MKNYTEIKSAQDLLTTKYNELVKILKEKDNEIENLKFEIELERRTNDELAKELSVLRNDVKDEIEKEINKTYGTLKSQISLLKQANEKHKKQKTDLLKKIQDVQEKYRQRTKYFITVLQKNGFSFSVLDDFPQDFIKAVLCR